MRWKVLGLLACLVIVAILSGADLTGAEVTPAQLARAKTLEGATLPDNPARHLETMLEEQTP